MSLFAYFSFSPFWFAIPPVVAFALVYAGTRHEEMTPILRHAGRVISWTVVFLVLIFVLLAWAT